MPLIRLQTSVEMEEKQRQALLADLSKLLSGALRKPEQYVMVSVEPAAMLMSGQGGPGAFADVRSIGALSSGVNKQVTKGLCALLEKALGIPPDRVYVNFTDVPAGDWGWDNDTFG